MVRLSALLCGGLIIIVVAAGCSTRRSRKDELGPKPMSLPNSIPGYSEPLDLREFDVDTTDGGARGVFLKLSRLPTGVSSTSDSNPARIILNIQGPTGTESPQEVFPGGDSLVTHVTVSRTVGYLQVVLELDTDDPPEYAVLPMADWVLVRIKPVAPRTHPWAHGA
jgi:hypothetical protein